MWKDFGLVDLHSSIHPLPTPQSEAGTMHVPYPERILSMCEKEADKFAWKRKQNSKLRWVSLNSRTNALLQLPYVDAHSCWLRKKRENLFFDESNCTFPELKLIIFCVILSLPTLSLFTSAQIRSTQISSASEDTWFPFPQCWKQNSQSLFVVSALYTLATPLKHRPQVWWMFRIIQTEEIWTFIASKQVFIS